MTIDERIEALTGRHEALAQSVELLVHSQQKNETLLAGILESIRQDAENIRALIRIASSHETRLTGLQGGRT